MDIESLTKAQELIMVLANGIEAEREILNGLQSSLNEYVAFLQKQIEELR